MADEACHGLLPRGIVLQPGNLFIETRELFIRAGDLFISMCEPFIGARDQLDRLAWTVPD